MRRQARRQSIDVERLLPREVWLVSVHLRRVLDLTVPESLEAFGVTAEELVLDGHRLTQDLLDHTTSTAMNADLLETWPALADLDQ